MWVCYLCSMQGGRQRARQTRKAHSRGCAVHVRREGGEIERTEKQRVFDTRWDAEGAPNMENTPRWVCFQYITYKYCWQHDLLLFLVIIAFRWME